MMMMMKMMMIIELLDIIPKNLGQSIDSISICHLQKATLLGCLINTDTGDPLLHSSVILYKIDLVYSGINSTCNCIRDGDGKIYDAYVLYPKINCTPICGEERKFALEILPKTLEDHFGYKLCIFERDISPGGAIIDDIQSSIDRSRRLIIILSRNYVSDQVMYELEIGLHKALVERKIRVILIEYMPKNDFDFLPKSLELLSSSQVVKWKEEKSLPLNSKFWKKLCYAMPAKPTISAACQGVTLQDRRKRTNAFCITSEPSLFISVYCIYEICLKEPAAAEILCFYRNFMLLLLPLSVYNCEHSICLESDQGPWWFRLLIA
uniref:Interleukin 18 receptor 1 n=1 Tax=Naja naja TaxID=35670 RepID=A0A8C6XDL7_NAJNA